MGSFFVHISLAMSVAEILVGNLEPGEEEREHRLHIFQLACWFHWGDIWMYWSLLSVSICVSVCVGTRSTSEENFAQLHLNVIRKNQKEYKQLQQQGAGELNLVLLGGEDFWFC